jgi:ABC-2 type transport system permease protein
VTVARREANALTGTGQLLRLALRRDRVMLPVWAVVLAASLSLSAAATIALYSDQKAIDGAAAAANESSAVLAMYGEVFPTEGYVSVFKMLPLGAVFVALFAMLLVRRHTRSDEETNRVELLAATEMGRQAPMAAAVLTGVLGVALAAVLGALGQMAVGLPVAGSVVVGLAWLAVGITFIGVTAVTAQISQSNRVCAGLTGLVIGVCFVLRGAGDSQGGNWGALSWISPLGWPHRMRPYAGDQAWIILPAIGVTVLLLWAATALRNRRDLGSGLAPARPGPATAQPSLRNAFGLAWRLQRGSAFAWSVAVVLGGLLIGGVAASAADMIQTPEARKTIEAIGGVGGITDVFFSVEFGFMAVIVSGFGIASILRLPTEESETRGELVLATATSRNRFLASHAVIGLVFSGVLVLLLGVFAGFSSAKQFGGVGPSMRHLLPAALVQVPAIWVVVAATVVLYAIRPRLAIGGWVLLAAFLLLGQLGTLLKLPTAVMAVSPFDHVPHAPVEAVTAGSPIVLVCVTAVLLAAAVLLFRRSDIT